MGYRRTVYLDGRDGLCPDRTRLGKLAGHLNARLMEYEEEGITSRITPDGRVMAQVKDMDGETAVRRLAHGGVYATANGTQVEFAPGAHTSFEDLDYVQGIAAGLL